MSMNRRTLALVSTAVCLLSCGGEEAAPPGKASPAASAKAAKKVAAPVAEAPAEPKAEGPPAVEFQETDFAESERSRDPFRSFVKTFVEEARGKVRSQREVVLDQYAVDELRLVGIVTRIQPERALLVDPTGKGHVIVRGQFVGRAEVVQGGGSGADYEINWRVDRIREGDIVLVREDPQNPDIPSATRVIALHPEGSVVEAAQ